MTDLRGNVALIVGGGSGVGEGVAIGLAREGMKVILADIDFDSAKAVEAEISATGGEARAFAVDASDTQSLQELLQSVKQEHNSIQLLISTVGAILELPISNATEMDWQWMINLNLMSNVRIVQSLLPLLKSSSSGSHIVLTGSGAGLFAPPPNMHLGLYATVKHALTGYAKSLRDELQPQGIGVSLLCPSGVQGNLAVTSAKSRARARAFNQTQLKINGRQPDDRTLVPSEQIGPLVIAAIKKNQFYIFNNADQSVEAVNKEIAEMRGG